MRKRIFRTIFLMLVLIILIFNFYYLVNFKLKQEEEKDLVTDNIESIRLLYENDLQIINPELQVVNILNDTLNFFSVLKNRYTLVIRISETSCNTCLRYLLETLKKYSDSFDIDEIIFLVNTNNIRRIQSFKIANNLKYTVYMFYSRLGLPSEKLDKPILFLLNNNMQTLMFSYADVSNPTILEYFLDELVKRKILKHNM